MYSLWQDLSVQKFWPCDLDLDFWPTFEKNLTLAITFEPREIRLHSKGVYSLWQDLSVHTRNFDLVTLTLTFDLLLKKLNLDHNFWTKSDWALILHISIPCDQDLSNDTNNFDLVALTLTLTYLWKNLNRLPRGVLVPLGQTRI